MPWRGLGPAVGVGLPRDRRGECVMLAPAGPKLEVEAEFGLYTQSGHSQCPHRALTGFLLFPP